MSDSARNEKHDGPNPWIASCRCLPSGEIEHESQPGISQAVPLPVVFQIKRSDTPDSMGLGNREPRMRIGLSMMNADAHSDRASTAVEVQTRVPCDAPHPCEHIPSRPE
jgi:hypothetical protein